MLLENDTGFCPWCKHGTAFRLAREVHYASPHYGGDYTFKKEFEGESRTGLLIYECLHCRKSIVLLEHELPPVKDVIPDGKRWRRMVTPAQSPRTLHESAPEAVRSLYMEASVCEAAGALRGAGVLYRAVVEELVDDQGASGNNLFEKIDSLSGALSEELIQDFHEARLLGNDSIHAGISYSAAEVADVAGLVEEAVLVLYVQPEQKRAMREARRLRRGASER